MRSFEWGTRWLAWFAIGAIACGRSSTAVAPAQPNTILPTAPVHAEARGYTVLLQRSVVGTATSVSDEREHAWSFTYRDRGRGPDLRSRISVDGHGVPLRVHVEGHDEMGAPVDETFVRDTRRMHWRNRAERGEASSASAFYVAFDALPQATALLARALLQAADNTLPLLPSGRAHAKVLATLPGRRADGPAHTLNLVEITGLGFAPTYVWLDGQGEMVASISDWLTTIEHGFSTMLPELRAAQRRVSEERAARLATELAAGQPHTVVFEQVGVFDAERARVLPQRRVVVVGERIASVSAAKGPLPADAMIIDGSGRTLLPGLWDMHVHYQSADGLLHLAAGVTTVRDLGNDLELLHGAREAIETGRALGPRIVAAGIIEGPGPFAGPTDVLVDTEDEARAAVERYVGAEYPQVKLYSSLDPALVPVIVATAHARGMRVSGHVPWKMRAEQAVRAGFDELQHVNFLVLNFLDPQLDTRTKLRFSAVADHAASIDLGRDDVRAFVALLRERDVVVDPTLTVFETMFAAEVGEVPMAYQHVAQRFPIGERRALLGGGLPFDDASANTSDGRVGTDAGEKTQAASPQRAVARDDSARADARQRRAASWLRLREWVALLEREGVRIVAGTDALPGFSLHRELENYVLAGIHSGKVLRLATLGAAEVMGMSASVGSIAPGKAADLVLVRGDPVEDIRNVRHLELTMRGGVVYRTSDLEAALGLTPD